MAGAAVEDGKAVKVKVTIKAMVKGAFGAIGLSGNLWRGMADGRDFESVAGTWVILMSILGLFLGSLC
jgi:hypothetical protein